MPELQFGGFAMTMSLPKSWPVPAFDYGDEVIVEPLGLCEIVGMRYTYDVNDGCHKWQYCASNDAEVVWRWGRECMTRGKHEE